MRSVPEYAAASWTPWLSATTTSKLERVQLEAVRSITGKFRSTPVDAVLTEYKLPPISTSFQTISLLKADEWAHLPPTDDRHQTLFTTCRQHLKNKDWRNTQLSVFINSISINSISTPNLWGYFKDRVLKANWKKRGEKKGDTWWCNEEAKGAVSRKKVAHKAMRQNSTEENKST